MGIVKLSPAFKDYLWGGTRLKEEFGKVTELNPLAESWEVSTHPDGESVLVSGEFKGLTLTQYIEKVGRDALGEVGQTFERFPVLVKFIDAKQDLSIQVHPDDVYGLEHEGEYGKTEMWVILDAKPGSKIYFGTEKEITKEEFLKSIEEDTILDVLKTVDVKKGDVIFVEAGTIHAIGAGIVICEIQQNSNTTYRVYDFNRRGADGQLRELHVAKAVDVSTLKPLDSKFTPSAPVQTEDFGTLQELATCKYFTTTQVSLNGTRTYSVDDRSFEALVVLEGTLTLSHGDTTLDLKKGESVFVDANTEGLVMSGHAQILSINV